MPVLLGNSYILPAIIVVVLLALLLLILVARARSAGKSGKAAAPAPNRRVSAPPKASPTAARATQSADKTVPERPATPVTTGTAQQSSPTAAASKTVSSSSVRPNIARMEAAAALPGTDPLQAIIFDILQGWGDVTEDDTKRLSLFKPEKVLAAAQATEITKELKSSKFARTRLAQLRQHALNTVERQQETTPQTAEPADVPTTVPAPDLLEEVVESEAGHPASEETMPLVAEEISYVEPEVPAAEKAPAPKEAPWDEQTPVGWEPAVSEASLVDDEAAPLAELPLIEEIPIEETLEEMGFETIAEMPVETTDLPVLETEPWEPAEQPAPAPPMEESAAYSFLEEPEDSVSALNIRIRTAEDLVALPVEEQKEMVAFLEPAELSKVFGQATDPEVKKAIIDTLEHVSNPSSLEVLRRCLDDPDPQIQLYALEAADRLLGVD